VTLNLGLIRCRCRRLGQQGERLGVVGFAGEDPAKRVGHRSIGRIQTPRPFSKLYRLVNLVETLGVEIREIVESLHELGVGCQSFLVGVAGSGIVREAVLDHADLHERRSVVGPGDETIEFVQGLLGPVGINVYLGECQVRGAKVGAISIAFRRAASACWLSFCLR